MPRSPSILRTAHGTGAPALLRAEAPPLDEVPPLSADATERGLAAAQARGRPFTRGNRAGANRGPSLARSGVDLDPSDAGRRKVQRRAESLRRVRVREMSVQHGGTISSAVKAEVASWALALAWSRHAYDQGDAGRGAKLASEASAHMLRATGLAEREARVAPRAPGDAFARWRTPEGEGGGGDGSQAE